MKILLVITKAVVGGAQMSVLNLAREMKKRGHEVFVGFGEGDFLPAELDKEKIPFIRFDFLKRTHNPLNIFYFIWEIKKYVSEGHFEALHFNSSNSLPGALGAKLANPRTRTIFTFRGMSMLDEHYEISPILKFLYRFYFKFFLLFVNVPVFVSGENFDKFGRGQLTNKGRLIYNGLDPLKLIFVNDIEARTWLSAKAKQDLSQKYLIGSIGRLDYAKNYEFLINVFPEVLRIRPDAVLLIMGEGNERTKYEALIKQKGLTDKIFLIGDIPNGGRYLKAFDLFVQTSRFEGLSIALIETLFAGLPILTSDVGGNKETVGALESEIYQLDDSKEFLSKFENLQDVDILKKAIENNISQALKFNLVNTANGYETAYKK